jgi:hypothetical protein
MIHIRSGTIDIEATSLPSRISREQLNGWIRAAARAASDYYGRFPVKRVALVIAVNAHGQEIHGRTFDGRRIQMGLGPDTTAADLKDDWVLTHEMFHLAFPEMGDAREWMNEGLSTYLEPIARARSGTLSVQTMWKETVEGMPQGQPEAGDRGLDHTHTWGRTYWGGCLFWLLADIQIREQTKEKFSLQDALRAVLDAGGDGSQEWPVSKVLDVADRATGVHVLHDLYDQMADKAVTIDLDALWKRLGVEYHDGRVTFNDNAPLASIRRALTAASKGHDPE